MGWWERLQTLGLVLPPAPRALATYASARSRDGLVYVSGQLPFASGALAYTGRVGADLDVEQGRAAARVCALNALAAAAAVAPGGMAGIAGVLQVQGWVQCGQDFHDQARVVDGASELFRALFDEAGAHVRVALGCVALPLDAAVELAAVFTAAP